MEDQSHAADAAPEIKHICNICNKVFPSHRALSGHKSSHTIKVSIINTEDVGKNDANAKGEGDLHVCQICSKSFLTARALSCHKRFHNNKGDGSKGGGEERVEGVKLLDFDLNMALDENGVAGGGDESHVHNLVN